jgi:hypothetical protein
MCPGRVETDEDRHRTERDQRPQRESGYRVDADEIGEIAAERIGVQRHRADVADNERPAEHSGERRVAGEGLDVGHRAGVAVDKTIEPDERVACTESDDASDDER